MVTTVLVVVPMVAMTVAMVVVTALFAPVVAVLRCRRLPGHHGGLVIGYRLHHTVLGLRLVVHDGRLLVVRGRLLVMGHRWVMVGRIPVGMVLAGNAGTDQTAGTSAYYCAIAATHMFADGSTGDGTNTGAQHRMEIIRMGCGGQAGQTAS